MKTKSYLKMLMAALIFMSIAGGAFATPVGFTVYLVDSYSAAHTGGSLEYRLGGGSGWITATPDGVGMWDLTDETDGYSQVGLRMTWNNQELKASNVPTSSDYTFQTTMVTIEFRSANGTLGYDGGMVDYTSDGWWDIGFTGASGSGIITYEMLPTVYTFRLTYKGQRNVIHTHHIVNDGPTVTFQMVKLMVQLNKSDGTRGLNGGTVDYRNYDGWWYFGTTGYANTYDPDTDPLPVPANGETGRVRKQLLPGTYKIRMEYAGDEEVKTIDVVNPTNNLFFEVDDLKGGIANSGNNQMDLVSYPNPFNSNTTIAFNLKESQNVNISIFDINGKVVQDVTDSYLQDGYHKFNINAEELSEGYYILRVNTAKEVSHVNIVKM